MKLNLGCGGDIRFNYVNVDKQQLHPSVINNDVRELDAIVKDGICEEIVANNIIEYLNAREMPQVLQSWLRKLAPGGTIFLSTVDYQLLANKVTYNNIDLTNLNSLLYDGREGIYDMPNLCQIIEANGCTITRKYYDHNSSKLFIEAVRDK